MKVKTYLGGALPLIAAGATLCTTGSATAQCASTLLYDNGFPNNCVVVGSQVNSSTGAAPAGADDFNAAANTTINDVHWYTADESAGIGFAGEVRLTIYPDDGNCAPDVANPVVSDDFGGGGGGVVTRTIVDAQALSVGGVIHDLVRYDLEKIDVTLSAAGTYWISVQPVSSNPAPGDSLWLSSNCAVNGDAIVGCPAMSETDAGAGFSVVEVPAAGDTIDLNFQLSTCPSGGSAPCPADIAEPFDVVNVFDLTTLLGNWGTNGAGADIADPTNIVNVFDLTALLGAWGPCPTLPGDNDDCENAELLIGPGDVPFSLADASPDGPADGGNCDSPIPNNLPDIWYCFKSECEGFTTITLDVATGLSVYAIAADSCNADPLPAPVACSNEGTVRFFAEAGFHYKIRISGQTSVSGNMNIADCEPFNDECVDAITIFTGEEFEGTLLGFSPDPDAPQCPVLQGSAIGSTPGVWFVTVGDGTTYTAFTCHPPAGLPPDPIQSDPPGQPDRIAVYCGTSCDGLLDPCVLSTEINCADFGGAPPGTQAVSRWCTVEGVIYFLYYSMDNNTAVPGPYRLSLTSNNVDCDPQSFEAACPGIPGRVCAIDGIEDGSPGDGCQLPNQMGNGPDGIVGATSDRQGGAGFTVADNFVPAVSGNITEVCWWGFYLDFTVPTDCAPGDGSGSSDDFQIRFFPDDGTGFPNDGAAVTYNIGSLQLNTEKIFTGLVIGSGAGDLQEFEYTAQISPGYAVTAGTCYWMEISNNTQANCFWLWSTAPPGNSQSAQDTDGDYAVGDASGYDLAWCIDLETTDPNSCPSPDDPQPVICALTGYYQAFFTFSSGSTSDADNSGSLGTVLAVADNFIVDGTGQSITGVCWWGIFLLFDPNTGFGACPSVPPATSPFSITYYGTTGGAAPLPDETNVLGGPFTVNPVRADSTLDFGALADVYEFSASHAAVSVTDGEVVWVEIQHTGNESCVFLWTNSPGAADGLAAQSTDGTYASTANDFGFRVSVNGIAPAPPGPPSNDDCADAETIMDGLTPYSTLGATTDGPANPAGQCDDFGATQTAHDIWFTYTASCTGTLTVSTCEDVGGSAGYDSDLVIYSPGWDCTNLSASFLDCNDDDQNNPCGVNDFHSTIMTPVTSGQTYLIRVGGWDTGDQGAGELFIDCQ